MEYNLEICNFLINFLNLQSFNSSDKRLNNSDLHGINCIEYYIELCYKIESNIVYFYWLLSLFAPLLKFFLMLFLTPFLIFLYFYVYSLILFFKKHWLSLKVRLI